MKRYQQIIDKYKKYICYDVIHVAKVLYFYRWELVVDTPGGFWSYRNYKTKKEAISGLKNSPYKDRLHMIHDKHKSCPNELVEDCKVIVSVLKFRKYKTIFEC